MNIKSLILGSVAAVFAAGSAQAADLPVAEPVDYVKVCDAFGAGYHYIPGTDTCLSIRGSVSAEIQGDDFYVKGTPNRSVNLVEFDADFGLEITAKEDTELGVLTGYIEIEEGTVGGTEYAVAVAKAYLSLGGFYAGRTKSLVDFEAWNGAFDSFDAIGGKTLDVFGYNMALGNGVTFSVALEEYNGNTGAGISAPAVAAALAVKQGWGEVKAAGTVYQIRYAAAATDTDMGYAVSGYGKVNLDMLSAGSYFAIAAGYEKGTGGLTPFAAGHSATLGTLSDGYAGSATLWYAFADNWGAGISAGLARFDPNSSTTNNVKVWGAAGTVKYTPVKNFSIQGTVAYRDYEVDNTVTTDDYTGWGAKLDLTRSF